MCTPLTLVASDIVITPKLALPFSLHTTHQQGPSLTAQPLSHCGRKHCTPEGCSAAAAARLCCLSLSPSLFSTLLCSPSGAVCQLYVLNQMHLLLICVLCLHLQFLLFCILCNRLLLSVVYLQFCTGRSVFSLPCLASSLFQLFPTITLNRPHAPSLSLALSSHRPTDSSPLSLAL